MLRELNPGLLGQGLKPFKVSQKKTDRRLVPMEWDLTIPFISSRDIKGTHFALANILPNFKFRIEEKKYRQDVLYSSTSKRVIYSTICLD